MDIQLRRLDGRELESYKGELPASAFKEQDKQQNKQDKVVDDDDDYDDGNGEDRNPNDDRSDSTNPNQLTKYPVEIPRPPLCDVGQHLLTMTISRSRFS